MIGLQNVLMCLAFDLARNGNSAGSAVCEAAADELRRLNARLDVLLENDYIGLDDEESEA